MALPPALPEQARQVLALARKDRRSAAAALDALPVDAQVALICETPAARRAELLDLLRAPEPVIRRLPEADLAVTVAQIGLADAAWILEHATDDQLVACVDLDAFDGFAPDRERLGEWMAALAEAGEETLLRAAHALDPENLVLLLRHRIEVVLKPDDDPGWQPPLGAQTIDGQFHFVARHEGDDLEPVLALLQGLFQEDYWLYFRLLQGVIWELDAETEEWALRWRTGRLMDLGFPPWEEAMAIYGFVRPGERAVLPPDEPTPLAVDAWHLPVWMPRLPSARDSQHAIFRGAGELDATERSGFLYAFLALVNRVAVADRLPLSEAGSIPAALERAAEIASAGLEHIATANALALGDVLRRVSLVRLYRVGASLLGASPEDGRAAPGAGARAAHGARPDPAPDGSSGTV